MQKNTPESPNTRNARAKRTTPPPAPDPGCCWIPLTRGLFALIDEADYELVSHRVWAATSTIRTTYATNANRQGCVLLHRLILNAPKGMQVDHINGNGLDCRRINIRLCTVKENHRNLSLQKSYHGRPKTSKYKGVSWFASRNKWVAKIHVDGKGHTLGYYTDEDAAAQRYDEAARKQFGEFARLNFPCK